MLRVQALLETWSLLSKLRPPRSLALLGAVTALLAPVGCKIANAQETLDGYKFSRDAQQGKKLAPVPLNLEGKNPDLVYLGSYLVNAQAGCNGCHTCPSFKTIDPYKFGGSALGSSSTPAHINAQNYLAGGTPFPGQGVPFQGSTLVAPNLTPDSSGLPGGLTYDEFKSAMQEGMLTSRKPGHVLQVMPWPVFRNMYENDLQAIYQYLRAIPSAEPGTCTGSAQTGN